jgi:hypothetical protein
MNRWGKALTAVVAVTTLAASTVRAQNASIQAVANVFAAITVTAGNDLDFGNVFPGVNKTVAVTDAGAGTFSATGQNSANVALTFTLPATLANGGNTMPIVSWTGCHDTDGAVAGCTTFTPSAAASNAQFSAGGQLFVWIGATVQPAANQAAGTYSGTVTIQLAYF